jgi:sortase A
MDNGKGEKIIKLITTLFLVIGLGVVGVLLWQHFHKTPEPLPEPIVVQSSSQPESSSKPEPESSSEPEPEEEKLKFPVGKFGPIFNDYGPDTERLEYVSGEMILRVPRMEYEGPVYCSEQDITQGSVTYQGVNNGVLDQGPGLFGASQMPSESNSNVCIAAHRDIVGKEFWDIDKVTEGDYLYLIYKGKEYVYLYENTLITHDRDWEPIRTKDYSCITLQSCTPIYIATERIFVTGKLVAVNDVDAAVSSGEDTAGSSGTDSASDAASSADAAA